MGVIPCRFESYTLRHDRFFIGGDPNGRRKVAIRVDMKYKKSKKLNKGDLIAIVSPSWGGPSVFPHIYENGLKVLQKWGLRIKEYPTARANAKHLRNNPRMRAEDLNNAFANKEVRAIITSIGGDDSVRILPYLNKNTIKANPKIFLGYSDTTAIHAFCNQLGTITFYGPSVMSGFSQMESLSNRFEQHVKQMLFSSSKTHDYAPYKQYCDGYPDWKNKNNTGKINRLKKDKGWRFLQGKNIVRGKLFGGCMEVLEMMKATTFWPKYDFWNGKIFFLETSEEKPSLHYVDHVLRNYGAQGVFDRIKGLIFGRARDYSEEEKKELDQKIVSVVAQEFKMPNLPVVTNVDFGHTDPQFVLPMGVELAIDCKSKKLHLVEPWLR